MANFTLIREILEIPRDKGLKRILLAVYEVTGDGKAPSRYLAASEQKRLNEDSPWVSAQKGITIRRGELENVIAALQSADFDAKPDGKNLSCQEYARTLDWPAATPGIDYLKLAEEYALSKTTAK